MVHRFQSNLSLSLSLWFCTKLAVICHYSVVLIQTLNCTVVVCPGQTAFSVLSFALLCFPFLSFDLFLPFSSGGNLLVTGFQLWLLLLLPWNWALLLPVCRHSFQFLCWLLCVQHFLHFHFNFPADAISNHCHNCLPLCPLLCFLLWNPRWCPLKKGKRRGIAIITRRPAAAAAAILFLA